MRAPDRDGCTRCLAAPPTGSAYAVEVNPLLRREARVRRAAHGFVPTLALALILVACAPAGPPFEPSGPCTVDGQAEGAYPELEGAIPEAFRGEPPTTLDSGRSCSDENLGTLAERGVEEVRFAGGLWQTEPRSGVTIARFTARDLEADWVAEFYEAGARRARRTEEIETGAATIAGRAVWRLDTLNDESFQSIVVWPDFTPESIWVVLAASDIREIGTREAHDGVVADAVAATGP